MRRGKQTTLVKEPRLYTAEERLMLAVLEQAFADLESTCPAVVADAEAYFLAYHPESSPLSFEAICAHFGLPAAAMRREVKRRLRVRRVRHAA